jgi:hypothetical protein
MYHAFGTIIMSYNVIPKSAPKGVNEMCFHPYHHIVGDIFVDEKV